MLILNLAGFGGRPLAAGLDLAVSPKYSLLVGIGFVDWYFEMTMSVCHVSSTFFADFVTLPHLVAGQQQLVWSWWQSTCGTAC